MPRKRPSSSSGFHAGQIASELSKVALASLADFQDEVEREIEATRKARDSYRKSAGSWRIADGKEITDTFTNFTSVTARLEVLAADRRWVEETAALECATEEEALTAIQERRAAWPALRFEKCV